MLKNKTKWRWEEVSGINQVIHVHLHNHHVEFHKEKLLSRVHLIPIPLCGTAHEWVLTGTVREVLTTWMVVGSRVKGSSSSSVDKFLFWSSVYVGTLSALSCFLMHSQLRCKLCNWFVILTQKSLIHPFWRFGGSTNLFLTAWLLRRLDSSSGSNLTRSTSSASSGTITSCLGGKSCSSWEREAGVMKPSGGNLTFRIRITYQRSWIVVKIIKNSNQHMHENFFCFSFYSNFYMHHNL